MFGEQTPLLYLYVIFTIASYILPSSRVRSSSHRFRFSRLLVLIMVESQFNFCNRTSLKYTPQTTPLPKYEGHLDCCRRTIKCYHAISVENH